MTSSVPILFSARGGVVRFCLRPIPDWTAYEVRRAINREGLDVPFASPAFDVWAAAYEQLRDAATLANQQRQSTALPLRRA